MSAKGSSSLSAANVLEQMKQKILNDHNKYRKQHHAPPLKLHDTLSKIAQDWSDQLLNTRVLKHRPASKFGENLWTGSGFTINDMLTNEKANPVSSWYAEMEKYPDAPFEKWGHFTQLIWKGSKYLGCGISYNPGVIFVVCNYDPPGNWRNKYHENIFTVEGAPWGDSVKDNDVVKDGSKGGSASVGRNRKDNDVVKDGSKGGSASGGRNRKDNDASLADRKGPNSIESEELAESSTPYWMYGLGLVIILLVVVFLAILIYYQIS